MDRGAAYSDCVVNVLPEAKRMSVLDLWDQGKGLREIERLTGVHRDTVMRLVLGPRANRKLKKLVFAIGDWLEARGLESGDVRSTRRASLRAVPMPQASERFSARRH